MSLLISDIADRALNDFTKFAKGTIEYAPFKVTVNSMHLSIVFSQSEQFSHLINCEFWFSANVCFLYEDICEVILNSAGTNTNSQSGKVQPSDEMQRNDSYIVNVVRFSKAHWEEIVEVPPRWYEKAVEVTDKKMRPIFPHVADEDLKHKSNLLKAWRNIEK